MASYSDFYRTHIGRAYDVDGYYGAQCWDGYAEYCRYLGVPWANCTATGYARDLWEQRHSNGILNHFTEVSVMKPGDVAIFKVCEVTPSSHVAIFHSDAGGGYGLFFGQNQGGSGGSFNLCKLPYSATYDTAFRPKAYSGSNTTMSSGYSEKQLINETGVATLTKAVNKRRDSPAGLIVETLPVGKKLEYSQKWVGNGHRYISWVETEPNGNKYRYFVAVSAKEDYNSERWATISAKQTSAPKDKLKAPITDNKVSTSNIKHWGIDISEHNGNIDLTKYKNQFIIIRIGWGNFEFDKKFKRNVEECIRLGIPFGFYQYSYALNANEAKAEADAFLKAIEPYKNKIKCGVWLDMEDADSWKRKQGWKINRETIEPICKAWCEIVEAQGYYTGIYTATSWIQYLGSCKDKYDTWVAVWGTNDGTYQQDTSSLGTIHQYTSIDTITGNALDKNVMYVDFEHYTVKNEENSRNQSSNDKKYDTKNSTDSDSKELTSLLSMIVSFLKKLLSIFKK